MKAPIKQEVILSTPSTTPLPLPIPVTETPIAPPIAREVYQGMGASPLATPTHVAPTDTNTIIVIVTATLPPVQANTSVVPTSPETKLVNTAISIATTTPNRTATALFATELTPTATPTALSTLAQAPTIVSSSTATETPLPTLTSTPTSSATAPATIAANSPVVDTATFVPTLTATATAKPTQTPTLLPTATPTLTPLPTATNTSTSLPTVTNTFTPLPTATNTVPLVPTGTPTIIPSATSTHTTTPLPTATNTLPPLPTATDTATLLPTATNTATLAPTATPSPTPPLTEPPLTETSTPVPTTTNTPKPDVVHQCGQVIEAETAILSGLMQVDEDQSASGGRYVHVPNGTTERSVINDDKMTFKLNLGQPGHYQFIGHVYGNNSGADSFFVQIDKHPSEGFIWGFQSNTSYQGAVIIPRGSNHPFEIRLEAGSHQLEIMLREDGARLDKIQLICVN